MFSFLRLTEGNPDSVHASLHRSSSLKTDRDTPRKKRRNSERRKTITPILSPSSSLSSDTSSPTKDISNIEIEYSNEVFQRCPPSHGEEKENYACKDEGKDYSNETKWRDLDLIQDNTEDSDKAVYKFLGEEVSVEKGIVKRQKMGITIILFLLIWKLSQYLSYCI